MSSFREVLRGSGRPQKRRSQHEVYWTAFRLPLTSNVSAPAAAGVGSTGASRSPRPGVDVTLTLERALWRRRHDRVLAPASRRVCRTGDPRRSPVRPCHPSSYRPTAVLLLTSISGPLTASVPRVSPPDDPPRPIRLDHRGEPRWSRGRRHALSVARRSGCLSCGLGNSATSVFQTIRADRACSSSGAFAGCGYLYGRSASRVDSSVSGRSSPRPAGRVLKVAQNRHAPTATGQIVDDRPLVRWLHPHPWEDRRAPALRPLADLARPVRPRPWTAVSSSRRCWTASTTRRSRRCRTVADFAEEVGRSSAELTRAHRGRPSEARGSSPKADLLVDGDNRRAPRGFVAARPLRA